MLLYVALSTAEIEDFGQVFTYGSFHIQISGVSLLSIDLGKKLVYSSTLN
jgi:hypothetical protein